uniref:Uncharacterized protein n=1 Tax=Anopheles quadriannulatus TaxID=34691 RepID=A0A182XTH8_ANOQN
GCCWLYGGGDSFRSNETIHGYCKCEQSRGVRSFNCLCLPRTGDSRERSRIICHPDTTVVEVRSVLLLRHPHNLLGGFSPDLAMM